MHQLVPNFILENYAARKTRGSFSAAGLFVDISGFSTLTDTLMSHGQHGAEVLAEVMRSALEPLMRSIYEQAGFIATQAGDAFTALFPLDDGLNEGCQRALAAAWNIQQRSISQTKFVTPYGEHTISAKVGAALGEVAWGIPVSEDGRQAIYYFQGTAVDGCAEAEHHARAGEVLLEASFAAQVQDLASLEPVNSSDTPVFRLVNLSTGTLASLPVLQPEVDLDLAGKFFPLELFKQQQNGEFRQVVGVFISLPTIRTEVQLQIFMESLFALKEKYGGMLKGLDFGDKGANLLLFWGAPVARENDVERALHFILELQTQTAIPINGGVTYRIAHAGFIGCDLREEYTAYGHGVNLAARFMTAAPRGEIWLDEEVAARSKDHYELDYIGEMNFKGFIQPQKVYTLIERKDEASLIYQGEMVGREVELQRLSVFVQPIFHGQFPGMLVVWGEPGMGKSRLVYEFLHRLRGSAPQDFKVFLAQTDEILRAFLNPFRYWLKVYFGVSATQVEARNKRSFNRKLDDLIAATRDPRLADELDRTRSFLGELVGLSWPDSLYEQLDAQGRYENTFIGLATLLQAESLQNPVVINLEDAHWLDEDSKAFLSYLFRVLAADERKSYPIAILATARFEGSGLPLENVSYQQVDLGQINRAGLAAMVESHLGGPAGEKLLNFLEERSEGNPFFAEQILHYLKEEKLLVYEANIWNVIPQQFAPLPLTIRALLVARLDRLEQEVKEVVQTAAVLGREFEVQLLGDMLKDRPMLTDDLCQAEGAAIWSPLSEIRYLFKHALLRDAAYRMQLRAKRQALHALAVEALEKVYEDKLSQQYGELAYHAERAGLGDKARHYLQLAGREAQQAYQNSLAIDYYSRAFALTPENNFTARFDLLSYREDIYNLLGEREKRLQDLEALQILSLKMNDPEKGVIVALRQADYAYDFGDFSQAIQFGELAVIQALTLNELGMAVSAYDLLSNALLHQNNLESAERYVELGLELASQIQDQADDSRLFNIQGMIAVEERNLNRAWSCFEQSLALAREKGNLLAQALPLNSLGMVAGFQGDFSAALAFYEQSLAICQQIGARSGEARVLGNLGWVLGNMGEYTKARAYAEQTLRIAREVGDRYNEAYGLINLSSYATALGDYETGLHSAEHSLTLARQIGEVFAEAWSLTYLGHCHFALKQYPEAGEAYQAALEIRRERNQALLATEPLAGLARVALENGDLLTAQMHVDPILDFLDSAGTLDGADEPLRIYLTCYLVLQKGGDKRAKNILITAHNLLQSRAESIKDEAARQAFLENIEHNQEILAAWENDQ